MFEALAVPEPLERAELQRIKPSARQFCARLGVCDQAEGFRRHARRCAVRAVEATDLTRRNEPTPPRFQVRDLMTRDAEKARCTVEDRDLDLGTHGPESIDEDVHRQLACEEVLGVEVEAVFAVPLVAAHPVVVVVVAVVAFDALVALDDDGDAGDAVGAVDDGDAVDNDAALVAIPAASAAVVRTLATAVKTRDRWAIRRPDRRRLRTRSLVMACIIRSGRKTAPSAT